MKIITANIGRDKMSADRVRADFDKIKKQKGAKFIGFQEIDEADPADEHSILRSVYRLFRKVGMKHDNPIVGPLTARVIKREVVFACHGIGGVTPNRYFTVAVFKHRGRSFVLINTHYPAFAFNGKNEPFQAEVMSAWQEQFERHKALVKEYHDKGYTVFWTGDVNRVDMPKVHPAERQLVTAGIDSISVIEGNHKFKMTNKGSFSLWSDHDARWVSGRLV